MIFTIAQTASRTIQVANSEILPVSEVTRDMIQPTGVRSKYENESLCRWLNRAFPQVVLQVLAEASRAEDEAEDTFPR